MFTALRVYKAKNGDCNVKRDWIEDPRLGPWCNVQRNLHRTGKLPLERVRKLNSIDFVWDPAEAVWDEMFTELRSFKEKNGNCLVPRDWEENPKLGLWCREQRLRRRRGRLGAERVARLEQLHFVWDRHTEEWEGMYAIVEQYGKANGDCNIPSRWKENPQAAAWCNTQRVMFNRGELSRERLERLRAIGFRFGRPGKKGSATKARPSPGKLGRSDSRATVAGNRLRFK